MDQATRVQRLRVHGQGLSASHARQHVTRWMERQTPTRLGLPPDAIVLLRSVRTPWSALHPDSPVDVLAGRLRSAVRPAMGTSPGPGCEAVWFADEAELLACLAHDSVQGSIGHQWWWQTWLGRRPTAEEALQAWLTSARSAPAAMVRLKAMGPGLAWARHIGSTGRVALLQAIQRHHPVAQGVSAWLTQALGNAEVTLSSQEAAADMAPPPQTGPRAGGPWPFASEPTPSHRPEDLHRLDGASLLLALCTLLHGSPHLALDARQLRARLTPAPTAPDERHGQVSQRDLDSLRLLAEQQPAQPHVAKPSPPSTGPRHARQDTAPDHASDQRHGEAKPLRLAAPSHGMQDASATEPTTTTDMPMAPSTPINQGPTAACASAAPTQRCAPPLHTVRSHPTQTSLGGVFFLLNVALAWELYGDFTRPRHALLSVSPWQFLHAAGIALLGRSFASDPIAGWLRAQAPFGRPRPAAAMGAAPLALLPEAEAHRLESLDAFRPAHGPSSTAQRTPRRAEHELSCWWPLLRHRLSLALNLPESEAIATCLRLPARIERRGERVDVGFSLHHLPLAVRLAGLDRNPGWVPASGCDVRFHFEA